MVTPATIQDVENLPRRDFRGILGEVMADELWNTLLKFHREVAVPEIVGTLREEINSAVASLRRETKANFDAVWKRFDRLESEYQALNSAVKRIDQR
jgi:hypothetical protein